jgi:hypothetical protein
MAFDSGKVTGAWDAVKTFLVFGVGLAHFGDANFEHKICSQEPDDFFAF